MHTWLPGFFDELEKISLRLPKVPSPHTTMARMGRQQKKIHALAPGKKSQSALVGTRPGEFSKIKVADGGEVEQPGPDPSGISGSEQHTGVIRARWKGHNRPPAGETLQNLSNEIDGANSKPTLGA